MNTDLSAAMQQALTQAARTSHGHLSDVSDATLKDLADAGLASKFDDDTVATLTDAGWERFKVADRETSGGVKYRIGDMARWEIPIALETDVPDLITTHYGSVRPKSITLSLTPNRAGWWCVSSIAVWGPKVKDGKVTTKREYSVLFSDWTAPGNERPDWLVEICQYWDDVANGVSQDEPTLPVRQRSPQRAAFESALNVLLITENLDGAKWAIGQIRWAASVADPETDRSLSKLADKIEGMLDKRTAKLATRDDR